MSSGSAATTQVPEMDRMDQPVTVTTVILEHDYLAFTSWMSYLHFLVIVRSRSCRGSVAPSFVR